MESVLRKHVHPAYQELASRSSTNHEHLLRAYSTAAHTSLTLTKQIALDGHQNDGHQDGRHKCQAGVALAQVPDLDRGKHQDESEANTAVERQELLRQREAAPGGVLAVEGQRQKVDDDHHRSCGEIRSKWQRLIGIAVTHPVRKRN